MIIKAIIEVSFVIGLSGVLGVPPPNSLLSLPQQSAFHGPAVMPFKVGFPNRKPILRNQKEISG